MKTAEQPPLTGREKAVQAFNRQPGLLPNQPPTGSDPLPGAELHGRDRVAAAWTASMQRGAQEQGRHTLEWEASDRDLANGLAGCGFTSGGDRTSILQAWGRADVPMRNAIARALRTAGTGSNAGAILATARAAVEGVSPTTTVAAVKPAVESVVDREKRYRAEFEGKLGKLKSLSPEKRLIELEQRVWDNASAQEGMASKTDAAREALEAQSNAVAGLAKKEQESTREVNAEKAKVLPILDEETQKLQDQLQELQKKGEFEAASIARQREILESQLRGLEIQKSLAAIPMSGKSEQERLEIELQLEEVKQRLLKLTREQATVQKSAYDGLVATTNVMLKLADAANAYQEAMNTAELAEAEADLAEARASGDETAIKNAQRLLSEKEMQLDAEREIQQLVSEGVSESQAREVTERKITAEKREQAALEEKINGLSQEEQERARSMAGSGLGKMSGSSASAQQALDWQEKADLSRLRGRIADAERQEGYAKRSLERSERGALPAPDPARDKARGLFDKRRFPNLGPGGSPSQPFGDDSKLPGAGSDPARDMRGWTQPAPKAPDGWQQDVKEIRKLLKDRLPQKTA